MRYNKGAINFFVKERMIVKHTSRVVLAWFLIFAMVFTPLAQNFAYATNAGQPERQLQENVRPIVPASQLEAQESTAAETGDSIAAQLEGIDGDEIVRVIVELSEEPIIETATRSGVKVNELDQSTFAAREEAISDEQVETKSEIEASGIEMEEKADYSVVLNGFAAEVKAEDVAEIAALDSVENVYISQKYYLPEPFMADSVDIVNAPQTWDLNYRGEGSIVAIVDSGLDLEHQDFQKLQDSSQAALTQSEVQSIISANGLKGRYVNEKIPYAYDYFDGDQNTKENSSSSHGMHVAGTAAGSGDNFKGVAPEAQVLAMKVFTNDPLNSYVYSDMYLRAINEAVLLGADVVNMSLGSPAGMVNLEDGGAEEKVFAFAEANGIVVAIAAGNERNTNDGIGIGQIPDNPDVGVVGNPSTNTSTLSVASYENTHTLQQGLVVTVNGVEQEPMMSNPHEASGIPATQPVEYVFVGLGSPEEIEEAGGVEGKVALVERGNYSFTEKKNWALEAGAVGLVIFNNNNDDSLMNMLIDPPYAENFPMTFIGASDGKYLLDNEEGSTLTFDDEPIRFANPNAGRMSTFSSWGPAPDLRMKPEITAPGGQINSTLNDNQYGTMSGTSMATPHVTGGVALVKQALRAQAVAGNDTGIERTFGSKLEESQFTKRILMNTATPIINPDVEGAETYYSIMQQGAGLMNLYAAVNSPVSATVVGGKDNVEDAKLELYELPSGTEEVSSALTLYNDGQTAQTYDITVTGLVEDTFENNGYIFYSETAKIAYKNQEGSVTVQPGETVTVNVPVQIANDELAENQFINGFIELESTTEGGYDLSLPFLGFYGNWSEPRALDGMWQFDEPTFFGMAQFQDREANWPEGWNHQLPVNTIDGQKVAIFNPERGLNPWLTILRNIDRLDASIEDLEGNTLRTINSLHDVYKIARLTSTYDAYYWHTNIAWDGRINGAVINDGDIYNYVMEAHLNYDGEPQRYDYAVTTDSVAPYMVEDSVSYDPETRALTFIPKDTSEAENPEAYAGVWEAYIHHPTLELDAIYVEAPENYVEGETPFSVVIPENWGHLTSVDIELVDNVVNWEVNNYPFENTAEAPDNVTITIFEPGRYNMAPETATIKGAFWGTNEYDELKIELLDENDNVIGTATDVTVEEDYLVIKDGAGNVIYEGPGYNFQGLLTTDREFVKARVQVIKDGEIAESIGLNYYVDAEPPVLTLKAIKCTDEATAEITIKASDNFPELKVYEVLEDGSLGENVISISEWSENNAVINPVEGEAKVTVQLEDGMNTFTYRAFDAVGNGWTESITIFRGVCEIFDEVDRTALRNALYEAYDQNEDLYTEESFAVLRNAFENGEDVFADIDATQAQIDAATEAIHAAIAGLQEKADPTNKEQLRWLVRLAKDIESNPELNAAMAKAEAVLADEDASQAEVNAAFDELFEAIRGDYTEVIIRPTPITPVDPTEPTDPEDTEDPEDTTPIVLNEVYGANRYETAVEISKAAFDQADHVVIAQGLTFPDALTAGPLASEYNAPLLLTPQNTLHPETLAELERLGAETITIVGGDNTITEDVVAALEAEGYTVNRIAGANRYETAALITEEVQRISGNTAEVVLVNGTQPADALAITPYAGLNNVGILLTNGTVLDEKTQSIIDAADDVLIAGGNNSVSEAIETDIETEGINVTRVAGANRYDTVLEIAKAYFADATHAVVASGTEFPDALAGSQLAIENEAPILLVSKTAITADVKAYIADSMIDTISILGGENTIAPSVRAELEAIVK